MKLDRQHPPEGTVRDWVDARAAAGGDAFVFSDGAAALDWPALQAGARAVAAALTTLGVICCHVSFTVQDCHYLQAL